jgi:hypothetical protein
MSKENLDDRAQPLVGGMQNASLLAPEPELKQVRILERYSADAAGGLHRSKDCGPGTFVFGVSLAEEGRLSAEGIAAAEAGTDFDKLRVRQRARTPTIIDLLNDGRACGLGPDLTRGSCRAERFAVAEGRHRLSRLNDFDTRCG